MKLLIHTAQRDRVLVCLLGTEYTACASVEGDHKTSEKLLVLIHDHLRKERVSLSDIDCIGVVAGPGPFTSVRVGVSVANALGYALAVPVVSVPLGLVQPELMINSIRKRLQVRNRVAHTTSPVLPIYDGEPNITQKKQK